MSVHSIQQKTLDQISHLSSAEVLLRLQTLHGLVFLQDHGKSVIGFLPQQYYLHQQNCTRFERTTTFCYQVKESACTNFSEIQFSNSIPHTNIGFMGGWIGFIGYDYATRQFVDYPEHAQPALYLGRYQSFLRFENNQWIFYSDEKNSNEILAIIETHLKQSHQATFALTQSVQASWTKTQYQTAFHQIQNYILAGDCYQINLTQQFKAKTKGLLLNKAQALWELTQAPYAGYLKLQEFELLSCSPELFIDFKSQNKMITRPIKGTMPRFQDPIQDQVSKQKLVQSEKDQAENLMIVDLLRNDLSLYAQTGSVKTKQLFEIESFNQVHHMVSEIHATLKTDVSPLAVLLAALPGGSITGAPKIRAMEIIHELEQQPRGAYCGSLGYFNLDGTGCWNILIRSIQKYQDDISVWAGGGITISSKCGAEYQECFDKISAILEQLEA